MIPLTRPYLDEREVEAVAEVLTTGNLTQGPQAEAFGRLLADYVGVTHAQPTSSCTTALHLVLSALGIGPGDEVIVPDFTFPATANAVIQAGARPVLVDIDATTFCASAEHIAEAITPQTRAIMPVHAFGLCADMSPIRTIAAEHGLAVIEDAACAIGATYHGQNAGSLGDVACFSFHPRKVITTGEGGAALTSDPKLAQRIRLLASHGAARVDGFLEFQEPGFNYRLSDVAAAIGIAQMAKLDWILRERQRIAGAYELLLAGIDTLTAPTVPEGLRHTFQSYVVTLEARVDRNDVVRRMRARGVEVTLGTYALHQHPAFQRIRDHDGQGLSASARAADQTLSLPVFASMPDSDVEQVVSVLTGAIKEAVVRP